MPNRRSKKKIEWDERRSVAVNARRVLPHIVADYFTQVRHFLAKDRAPAELHRMRLAAKRLRYTLELFRPCYGPALEQRLDALKILQDSLGEVNDAVAAGKLLGHTVEQKLQAFLRDLAAEKAAEFRRHWSESFDAPGREKWWTGYLAAATRIPVRRRSSVRKPPGTQAARVQARRAGQD